MKKSARQVLAIVLSLMMVMVMVAACGSTTTQQAASTTAASAAAATAAASTTAEAAKPVTFIYQSDIGEANKDMVGAAFLEYAKTHTNVKMETQIIDHAQAAQKLQVEADSNTLPDLFWQNGPLLATTLANTKSLVDCTPFYDDAFKATLSDGALTLLTTVDGKIAGFPAEMQVQGFMYNKALFDKAGVAIPKTDADLLSCIPALKKIGVTPFAIGTKDPWPTWTFQYWNELLGFYDNGAKVFGDHSMKYQDSGVVEAYKYIAQLRTLGAFPENASTINFEQMVSMFVAGKAAMITMPSDQLGKIIGTAVEKDVVFNWGITFSKSPFSQNKVIKAVYNGYGIGSAAAQDKDKLNAIIDFNKWRFGSDGAKAALTCGFNMPVKLDIDFSQYSPIVQQQAAMIGDSNTSILPCGFLNYMRWGQNMDVFQKFYTPETTFQNALIDGSKKVSDIPTELAKIDKTIDDVLSALKTAKK